MWTHSNDNNVLNEVDDFIDMIILFVVCFATWHFYLSLFQTISDSNTFTLLTSQHPAHKEKKKYTTHCTKYQVKGKIKLTLENIWYQILALSIKSIMINICPPKQNLGTKHIKQNQDINGSIKQC